MCTAKYSPVSRCAGKKAKNFVPHGGMTMWSVARSVAMVLVSQARLYIEIELETVYPVNIQPSVWLCVCVEAPVVIR